MIRTICTRSLFCAMPFIVCCAAVVFLYTGCDQKTGNRPETTQPVPWYKLGNVGTYDPNNIIIIEDDIHKLPQGPQYPIEADKNTIKPRIRHNYDNMPMFQWEPDLIGPREFKVDPEGHL